MYHFALSIIAGACGGIMTALIFIAASFEQCANQLNRFNDRQEQENP